jgi:hypothetical protein
VRAGTVDEDPSVVEKPGPAGGTTVEGWWTAEGRVLDPAERARILHDVTGPYPRLAT